MHLIVIRNIGSAGPALPACNDLTDWILLRESKMTHSHSRKQSWLPLMAVLWAGLMLASYVSGQETSANSFQCGSQQLLSAEPAVGLSPTPVLQSEFNITRTDSTLGSAAGLVVYTSRTCLRTEPVCICEHDDIWLISARESHAAPADLSRLKCSHLIDGGWQDASLDELVQLHSTDKSKVTMLYVHGNRTALKWAISRGLQFYEQALQTEKRPPMRFVIFAWRSDVERARIFADYDIKSRRSVTIGDTFGLLLCRFEDRNMVLGGFSLGAQVVLKALSKPELQLQQDRFGKYRVAILAPALNPCYIQSDLIEYPQNPLVHRTEVFLNCDDHAVKLSQTIARRRTQSTLRLQDLAKRGEPGSHSIGICNITFEVNGRHSVVNYGRSASMNVKLASLLNATFEERILTPAFSSCPGATTNTEARMADPERRSPFPGEPQRR